MQHRIFQLKSSVILIVLVLVIQSCDSEKNKSEYLLKKWYQKEIRIPKNLTFKSMGHVTVNSFILNHEHKILVYIDSLGCSACRLKLSKWKEYMDTCQQRDYDVGFLFVVQSNNYREFEYKLSLNHFIYPIIYDPKDEFNKLNKFPKEELFRTFLLDDKNRVVLIGSPLNNKKLSDLYNEVIGGRKKGVIQTLEIKKINTLSKNIKNVKINIDSVNLGKFLFQTTK